MGERGPAAQKAYYKAFPDMTCKTLEAKHWYDCTQILPPKELRVAHVQEKRHPDHDTPDNGITSRDVYWSDVAIKLGYRGYLRQPGENGARNADPYHEPLPFLDRKFAFRVAFPCLDIPLNAEAPPIEKTFPKKALRSRLSGSRICFVVSNCYPLLAYAYSVSVCESAIFSMTITMTPPTIKREARCSASNTTQCMTFAV